MNNEGRGIRVAKEKHKTGKLKYGSVSVLMIVMVLTALIALNAGVYALEKKKGWRILYKSGPCTGRETRTPPCWTGWNGTPRPVISLPGNRLTRR